MQDSDSDSKHNLIAIPDNTNLSSEEMDALSRIMACMGVKPEEIPGNILTFLAMVGQGLFGGQLAFTYLKLGLKEAIKYFSGEDPSPQAEIAVEATAGCVGIIIAAAVIWGKYKLVRSYNRATLTAQGMKEFFTLNDRYDVLKALVKLPFVLIASSVFAGLNGVSLDGFSTLLLNQSNATVVEKIAGAATSIPSKSILGICAFTSNYFGFFWIMGNGADLTLDILYRKNPFVRGLTYTAAEERIIASIRTLRDQSGTLYEKSHLTQLDTLLNVLLGQANTHLTTNVSYLEKLLTALKSKLNDGSLVKNIIKQYITTYATIPEENKIPARHPLRQFGQYLLGVVGAGMASAGLSNFIDISSLSIEQLTFGYYNLSAPLQIAVGSIDYTAMIMLALAVYGLGHNMLAPTGQSTVGDLSKARKAYIGTTCILGGAPNILQSIIAKQNPVFIVLAEFSSIFIEVDGFNNIEKQQYLESLKDSDPLLWFMISFHGTMEEAIQKISALSPEDLKEFHDEFNLHLTKAGDKTSLPKGKYICSSGFWKPKAQDETTSLIVNLDDSKHAEVSVIPTQSRCNPCAIQ